MHCRSSRRTNGRVQITAPPLCKTPEFSSPKWLTTVFAPMKGGGGLVQEVTAVEARKVYLLVPVSSAGGGTMVAVDSESSSLSCGFQVAVKVRKCRDASAIGARILPHHPPSRAQSLSLPPMRSRLQSRIPLHAVILEQNQIFLRP